MQTHCRKVLETAGSIYNEVKALFTPKFPKCLWIIFLVSREVQFTLLHEMKLRFNEMLKIITSNEDANMLESNLFLKINLNI